MVADAGDRLRTEMLEQFAEDLLLALFDATAALAITPGLVDAAQDPGTVDLAYRSLKGSLERLYEVKSRWGSIGIDLPQLEAQAESLAGLQLYCHDLAGRLRLYREAIDGFRDGPFRTELEKLGFLPLRGR